MLKRTEPDGDGPTGEPTGGGDGLPTRKPALLIVHQEKSNPGHVARWFRENGFPVDVRRPRFGGELPETLENFSAAVIFGGPMSANDTDDFICRETAWIDVALREEVPFLGVCLGGQMLARHLGAGVSRHPDGLIEVGYYPLKPTAAGAALTRWPEAVYQWHTEGFDVPDGGVRLAETASYPNQAFSYGPAAAGLQFHPEITYALVNRWTSMRPDRIASPGARARAEHFEGHLAHAGEVYAWLDRFMRRLLARDMPDAATCDAMKIPSAF